MFGLKHAKNRVVRELKDAASESRNGTNDPDRGGERQEAADDVVLKGV